MAVKTWRWDWWVLSLAKTRRLDWWVLLLAIILVIPSTRDVHRFVGTSGLVLYAGCVVGALFLLQAVITRWFLTRVSRSQATWLAAITFVALVLIITVIYPIADSGQVMGGSDRDEALTVAASELVNGRYPYTPEGYTGEPITPGPGAIILAIPFVLIGNVAYQSVFWMGVAYLAFRRYLGDGRRAILLLWTFLGLAPVVLQQFVTGADLVSNALYLSVFMWLLSTYAEGNLKGRRLGIIASILLGIGLASRLNYLILAPLIFAMVVRGKGWKEGIICSLVAVATFAIVTVPFYIKQYTAFPPLHVQHATHAASEIQAQIVESLKIPEAFPIPVLVIPACVLVLVLALRFQGSGFRSLMMNSAIVQFAVIMPYFVMSTHQIRPLNFAFSDIGIAYMVFGVLAIWPSLGQTSSVEQEERHQRRAPLRLLGVPTLGSR